MTSADLPPADPLASRASRRVAMISTTIVAAAVLAACKPTFAPAVAAPAAAPPPEVAVVAVEARALELTRPQLARIEAAERVDIVPRVAGHVEAVLFRDGDIVRAGQPLFRIDPRPFDAVIARARADLQLARVREDVARTESDRARALAVDAAIAPEEAERRAAAYAEAQARRAAAEAALQSAVLDRDYAVVKAPITGRIGRALTTAGNFVGGRPAQQPLASIVAVAPMHVHFDVADRELVERAAVERAHGRWHVRILDADGQRELARAPVDFSDNEIVSSTGTLRLRARIDAPHPRLVHGLHVRVELSTGRERPVLLVPDAAIGTEQGTRFVLVVGPDGKVAHRTVEVGPAHGGHRVVLNGLSDGEQVVVSGLMRVRPGMAVRAVPVGDPSEQARTDASSRS